MLYCLKYRKMKPIVDEKDGIMRGDQKVCALYVVLLLLLLILTLKLMYVQKAVEKNYQIITWIIKDLFKRFIL